MRPADVWFKSDNKNETIFGRMERRDARERLHERPEEADPVSGRTS